MLKIIKKYFLLVIGGRGRMVSVCVCVCVHVREKQSEFLGGLPWFKKRIGCRRKAAVDSWN